MASAASATSTPAVTFEIFDEKWEEKVQTIQEGSEQEVTFGESFPIAKASIEPLSAAVQAKIDGIGDGETCTKDSVDAARGFIEQAAVLHGLFAKVQANKAFFDEHVKALASKSDGEARASVLADLGMSSSDVSRALSERDQRFAAIEVKSEMLGTWTTELGGMLATLAEKIEALKVTIIPGEGGAHSALFDLETDPTAFFEAKALFTPIMGGIIPKGSAQSILNAGRALAKFAGELDSAHASYDFLVVGDGESGEGKGEADGE